MKLRWVFLVVLGLVGCGGGGDDGGGDTHQTLTVGQACSSIGGGYCQRAKECSVIASNEVATCVGVFVMGCCGGPPNVCQRTAIPTADDLISSCLGALDNYDCTAVNNGTLPPACIGASKPHD